MKMLNETDEAVKKIKILLKEDGVVLNKFFTKQLTQIVADYGTIKYDLGWNDAHTEKSRNEYC